MSAKWSAGRFAKVVAEGGDLLRWRSPLRTELWASRITASWLPDGGTDSDALLERAAKDGGQEARLLLAALAVVGAPEEVADLAGHLLRNLDSKRSAVLPAGSRELPEWVGRMGQVICTGAWYGKADPYGEQVLAVLGFQYVNGKEPHLVVVGIDQVHGGLAIDALVEEPKFLDGLKVEPAEPGVVAGRVLDAFSLTDSVLGAATAETLDPVRSLVLARARSVPGLVRHAPDTTMAAFAEEGLPDIPGAQEAFDALTEFVGDRPLWWSPARVSQFIRVWLPREAILSDAAIMAMPEVVRAWTIHANAPEETLARIDAEIPQLPALMADPSLAGHAKRLRLLTSPGQKPDPDTAQDF